MKGASTRSRLASVALALAALACDGYAELPLPLREFGRLRVERAERFTEGPGLAQVALDAPSDALGPFVIVGRPVALNVDAAVLSWAVGPCTKTAPMPDPALRLCLAVEYARGGAEPGPLAIGVVVESRGDARRFTLTGTFDDGGIR